MALPHETPLTGYSESIGGSAGNGTHGGNVSPPSNWQGENYDYEAENYDQFVNAVQDSGARVRVADHIIIPPDADTVWFADDVTVEGDWCDPSVKGTGHWIRLKKQDDGVYPRKVFGHQGGTPPSLLGVYALGPETEYFDPDHESDHFGELTSSFFHEMADADDGLFEVRGSRFSGWTLAGLEIGAKSHRTNAEVSRTTFCMNMMEHLGYGVEHYRGDIWFDRCFLDTCRHGIAGFGYADETIDVTNSLFGPGPWAGHTLDMHGLANNTNEDTDVAGKHLRARNCTFLGTRDVGGYDQEAIAIRGVSESESQVYNCEFAHPNPPNANKPNTQGEAVRQEVSGDNGWENLRLWNNVYNAPKSNSDVGAPMSNRKPGKDNGNKNPGKPTSPGQPTSPGNGESDTGGGEKELTEPTQKVVVEGRAPQSSYWLFVNGDAKNVEDQGEAGDKVVDNGDETVIKGVVNDGWKDHYELSKDAHFKRAWFGGHVEVLLDEEPVSLASLVAAEADNKFN